MSDRAKTCVAALEALSQRCYAALSPASYWGGYARDNAAAVLRDGASHPEWLRMNGRTWREFADRTDPDIAPLAKAAADALEDLADHHLDAHAKGSCLACKADVSATFTAEERLKAHGRQCIPVKCVWCAKCGAGTQVAAAPLPLEFYPVTP